MRGFLKLCKQLGIPVALEKTEWGTTLIVFLGVLLNGIAHALGVPEDKRLRALHNLQGMLNKKKAMIKQL